MRLTRDNADAGLIPTHAGKTRHARPRGIRAKAHPHSRGENLGMRPSGHSSGGSSPLTRGKLCRSRRGCGRSRLIPTHAGKTVFGDACQVPGFVEACLGRFLSCCCVLVFCLLWCDSAQGEVRAACVVPVDPG